MAASSCCKRGPKARMSTRERLFLTPVEKCTKYGIVPWKMILNLSLVGMVTCQVLVMNSQESNYIQFASRNFYYYLFPTEYDFSTNIWYIYTVNDTVEGVQYALSNFFNLTNLSPDSFFYNYVDANQTIFQPATLEVESFTDIGALFDPNAQFNGATQTTNYYLNGTYFGPLTYALGYASLQNFFHSLVTMTLYLPPLQNFAFGTIYRNCLVWSLALTYDFSNRGQIQLTMDQNVVGTCDVYTNSWTAFLYKGLWLNFVVIAICVTHSGLLLKAVIRSFTLLRRVHHWADAQAAAGGSPAEKDDRGHEHGNEHAGLHRANNDGHHAPALTREAAVGDSSVRFDFHTDVNLDGEGDIFVTATTSNAGKKAKHNTIVFDSGEDSGGNSGQPVTGEEVYESLHEDANHPRSTAATVQALQLTWSSLSWRDKLRFINGWTLWSLAADAFNITSSVLNLLTPTAHLPSDDGHSFCMGMGLAFLWVGVLRYLEHNRSYFNIVLTLRRSGPRVLRFLVGVLPLFIAYSLFAVVMFSDRVPRFCDVRTAFVTLFANLNGDVVRETMMAIVAYHPTVGQLFFYSFIALHIYVVLNIIIAVVEESYFITAEKTEEMQEKLEEEKRRMMEGDDDALSRLSRKSPTGSSTNLSQMGGEEGATDPRLVVPAKTDSNSIKDRPNNRLAALLRLAEWQEIETGQRIGSSAPHK